MERIVERTNAARDRSTVVPTKPVSPTKLTIPRLPPTLVPRPELVVQLNDPSWRLGVVSAPAGFGKTTLLSAWVLERQDRPAWFTCDSSDAEPVRFWSGLLEALAACWPGMGDDARVALGRSGFADQDIVLSLANDLTEAKAGSLIVIDDLHNAGSDPATLASFVAAVPDGVRLLIGSRRQLPFSLARRRVAGDLLELHTDDLRLTAAEARAMLDRHAVELSPTDATRLHALTEGWPAALQMAAISLGRTTERAQFLDAFASSEGPVADYLLNEVLAGLPDDRVQFLMTTAVLDEFDVELCERITERSDAWSILHELIAAELFLIPLDGPGDWYRYHHLFGAVLLARLRAQNSSRLRQIHAEAARALEERGLVVRAMRHALAVDDREMTVAIARRGFDAAMHPVDAELTSSAARLWLHERGYEAMTADPMTVLALVAALSASAGSDDVANWLERIDATNAEQTPETTVLLQGTWADHHLGHGHVGAALDCISRALGAFLETPSGSPLLKLLHPVAIRARLSAGDIDDARASLDQLAAHPLGHPALDDVRLPSLRAWIGYLDGDLTLAGSTAEMSIRHADALGVRLSSNEPGRIVADLVIAGIHAERMNDGGALEALGDASTIADFGGRAWFRVMVLLQQAAVARMIGDASAATTHLALARSTMPSASIEVERSFALEAARQAVRFQPWAADGLVDDLESGAAASVVRAQLALERGERGLAAAAAESLPGPSTTRERVEYGMLHALTAHDIEAALVHLEEVLAVAAPQGFLRTVTQAGPRAAELLSAVPVNSVNRVYLDRLRTAASATIPPERGGGATPLIDPLSDRELVVLRYLSSRLTNPEIAAALHVSVNTQKSHVKAVFRKLDVSSRADAVEAGRRNRLI